MKNASKAELFGANQSSVPTPLLSLYKKSLREARRAKPLMSWRRLYLRKSAKKPTERFHMCYILSIERQLLRKAFIPKEVKSAKETTNGEREGCRSASRSHGIRQNLKQHFPSLAFIEKKNLGDEILITLPQAKIEFGRADASLRLETKSRKRSGGCALVKISAV